MTAILRDYDEPDLFGQQHEGDTNV